MRRVPWKTAVGLSTACLAAWVGYFFFRQANEMAGLDNSAAGRSVPADESPDEANRRVFASPLAGTWYRADKEGLTREITRYLEHIEAKPLGHVCGLVLPHAGYRWSGPTAAYGVKQIEGQAFRRVVVIGPSHRLPMENVAGLPAATHFATPLGEIPLDQPFLATLAKQPVFQVLPRAHDQEHSVGIELPLLQQVLGRFQLVPIVVGQLDLAATREIAKVLASLLDGETLVVASSDFTHYGMNFDYYPFRDDVPENLKKLDMGAVEQITRKDLAGFYGYLRETGATVCGRNAIGVLLAMLPPESQVDLLHYDTSGRLGGDYSSSVSYASIAFTGRWPQPAAAAAEPESAALSHEDRQRLLQLARATLQSVLKEQRVPSPSELPLELTPALQRVCGAFVTLHKHGRLRGCVGEIQPLRPLYKAVMQQAVNAALHDTRFPPVQESELGDLVLEISVLTPPKPVKSSQEIVVGRHGIILEKSGQSAVFLPQVALEQRWDLEQTLEHLARKAGLPDSAWREGATFSVFEAIVFGEDDE